MLCAYWIFMYEMSMILQTKKKCTEDSGGLCSTIAPVDESESTAIQFTF